MKQREYEAARLEADYMNRVRAALSDRSLEEQMEILQAARARVEQQLTAEPVTMVAMAGVLQQLGSPETFAAAQVPPIAPQQPPEGQLLEYRGPDTSLDRAEAADLLRRIWIGQAISVFGLFVPVVDLEVCAIAGSIIIATAILRRHSRPAQELRLVGELECICAGLTVAMSSVSAASLLSPNLAFGQLLLFVPLLICAMVSYWKQLSTCAGWVALATRPDLADSIRRRRNIYVFAIVPATIVIGIVLGNMTNSSVLAQFLFLPVTWIFGYFFILSPISQTRDVLLDR